MPSVTYSMGVSLDGYIVGPDGGFDWGPPDQELFRFYIDETRELAGYVMGRRLYETMLYWETADQVPGAPSLDDDALEWAAVWRPSRRSCSPRRCRPWRGMLGSPQAAWSRRSSDCGPSRRRATSPSVVRLSR